MLSFVVKYGLTNLQTVPIRDPHPIIIDKPMTLEEFQEKFNTEAACAEALFTAKWPHGFQCPRCGSPFMSIIATRRLPLYECKICRRQTSLLHGTIMECSRTDLRKWFLAFYLFSRERNDLNAVRLKEAIQVTYKTAWLMLTKIRAALGTKDKQKKLTGHVRINPATYGTKIHASLNRHPQEHPLLIAAELNQNGQPTYIKIKQILNKYLSGRSVNPLGVRTFLMEHTDAEPASRTYINPITGEKKTTIEKMRLVSSSKIDYIMKPFSPGRCRTLRRIALDAASWINTTFHSVGRKHLQKYLDEYCFRINQIKANQPIFEKLLSICTSIPALTYQQLTKP